MRKTSKLRELISRPEPLIMPGGFSPYLFTWRRLRSLLSGRMADGTALSRGSPLVSLPASYPSSSRQLQHIAVELADPDVQRSKLEGQTSGVPQTQRHLANEDSDDTLTVVDRAISSSTHELSEPPNCLAEVKGM